MEIEKKIFIYGEGRKKREENKSFSTKISNDRIYNIKSILIALREYCKN